MRTLREGTTGSDSETAGKTHRGGSTMIKRLKTASAFIVLVIFAFCSQADAFAGVAKNHKKLMANEEYAMAYEQMANVMNEAKERLDAGEFKALDQENAGAIAESVREGMETGGIDEPEAYATAYWMRSEYVSHALVWDWLRKNPRGVQGFYRLKSGEADGYMTITESDEKDVYEVYVSLVMKGDPKKAADLMSIGTLDGQTMTAGFPEDEEILLNIVFKGETASVISPDKAKKQFLDDCGMVFDGEYEREKKNAR